MAGTKVRQTTFCGLSLQTGVRAYGAIMTGLLMLYILDDTLAL